MPEPIEEHPENCDCKFQRLTESFTSVEEKDVGKKILVYGDSCLTEQERKGLNQAASAINNI